MLPGRCKPFPALPRSHVLCSSQQSGVILPLGGHTPFAFSYWEQSCFPNICMQVCSPAWFAASVVHHPLRLHKLVSAFLEAFAFDASVAGMLLYAAAAPSGSAASYAPGSRAEQATADKGGSGTSAVAEQLQHGAGRQLTADSTHGSMVLLPRMPLGLVLITTTATYEAVAAALRAAAALAAAADATPGSSGTALRGLFDSCLDSLRQALAAAAASGNAQRCDQGHKGSLLPSRDRSNDAQERPDELAGLQQTPWQLRAASVAAVLAELLLGASPAWRPSWHLPANVSDTSSTTELEVLAALTVQELVQDGIWSLPTAGNVRSQTEAAASHSKQLLLQANDSSAPQEQQATTQTRGCNALLVKAALECCGTAARALGLRFAQNGRLLRATLLPMLEKLGEFQQLPGNFVSHP